MTTNENTQPIYPHESGDVTVLGPQIIASTPDPTPETVINWRGENFTVQADEREALRKMRDVHRVQGADGNWDYDEYMRGMFNGMELMLSIAEGERAPEYRDRPKSEPATPEEGR